MVKMVYSPKPFPGMGMFGRSRQPQRQAHFLLTPWGKIANFDRQEKRFLNVSIFNPNKRNAFHRFLSTSCNRHRNRSLIPLFMAIEERGKEGWIKGVAKV
jgi:hypothetical protein